MGQVYEPATCSLRFSEADLLVRAPSKKAVVELWQCSRFGKILVINGEVQHVEAWAHLYHEPLVHLPASFLPRLEDVIILGGGSLFAAFEALKYNTVRSVRLVDHDPAVLQLMSDYYPHGSTVLDDPRFRHIETDVISFLAGENEPADLIVNDCLDLLERSRHTERNLFLDCVAQLNPTGICSDTTYRNVFEENIDALDRLLLSQNISKRLGLISIPEYPGVLHLHMLWGNFDPSADRAVNEWQIAQASDESLFQFYSPAHRDFFCYLPPGLRRLTGQ